MKRARALSAEPPLLTQYRQNYPSEELRPATEAGHTWETFKADQRASRELLDRLVEAQQGLCIYCEQRLVDKAGTLVPNDYQVEHVLAKSGAVGRVLDWMNLALACAGATYPHHQEPSRKRSGATNMSCGQSKADDDLPTGGDPRKLPLVPSLLDVGLDGKLAVNAQSCAAQGVSPKALEETLTLLNLNCERLRKARQERHDHITAVLVLYLEEVLGTSHLDAADRQQALEGFIKGRLQPDSSGHLRAFWTTERSALGAPAEAWIADHPGLFA